MLVRLTGNSMARVTKAAVVLILLSTGGFLVYRGLSTYFGASNSQKEAAASWHPYPGGIGLTRRSSSSITRPKAAIPEGQTFSRLDVPRLNQSLYVVEGDNDSALEKGPGHVRGSAMPGEHGNCVIAGHRDLHFRFLKNIEPGDEVFLETAQGRFRYRVTGTKIITPNQIQVLQPTPDAELHLITCYPFYFLGHAPKRFVVTAELDQPFDAPPPLERAAFVTPPPAVQHHQPAVIRHKSIPYRQPAKHAPSPQSMYERSLAATRALNRAAANDLQTSLSF